MKAYQQPPSPSRGGVLADRIGNFRRSPPAPRADRYLNLELLLAPFFGWVKHGSRSSSVASHVVCDAGTASQRAPLNFGGKMDQRAHSKLVMSCPKSELYSLFTSWSTLLRLSRTGLIQHCLQMLLLWQHWSQSRLDRTALLCTARVSSLKQAQHKTALVRGAVKLHAVGQHCLFCSFCNHVFMSFFCAASKCSIPVLAAGTAIQALQRLAASNPKLYKALLGMKKDSHGCISTATLMQVNGSMICRATNLCSLASCHAYTWHLSHKRPCFLWSSTYQCHTNRVNA